MSCPICGKATVPKMRPFCSKRCADLDLGRWLTGSYSVPSDDPENIEAAHEAAQQPRPDSDKLH